MRSPLVTQMKRTSLLGPVAQDLLHASLVVDGDVHAARAPEDVVELQAGLADGRVIDDRQEAGRIRHQGAVEQRLVLVEQPDQVDVAIEIGGLVSELLKDAPQLHVLVLDDIRQQTSQTQRLALGERERRGLVEAAVVEEVHAALAEQPFGGRPLSRCSPSPFPKCSLQPIERSIPSYRLLVCRSARPRGECARVLNATLTAAGTRLSLRTVDDAQAGMSRLRGAACSGASFGVQRPRPCRARPRWRRVSGSWRRAWPARR